MAEQSTHQISLTHFDLFRTVWSSDLANKRAKKEKRFTGNRVIDRRVLNERSQQEAKEKKYVFIRKLS